LTIGGVEKTAVDKHFSSLVEWLLPLPGRRDGTIGSPTPPDKLPFSVVFLAFVDTLIGQFSPPDIVPIRCTMSGSSTAKKMASVFGGHFRST
jgi:hypothetical protein